MLDEKFQVGHTPPEEWGMNMIFIQLNQVRTVVGTMAFFQANLVDAKNSTIIQPKRTYEK